MNPEQYKKLIIPRLQEHHKDHCLCKNSIFRKILSFNFEDYGISPTGLADSEIIISQIIHSFYTSLGTVATKNSGYKTKWQCKKCNFQLTEIEEQFSISMHRSYIALDQKEKKPDLTAPYLIGFYGFSKDDFHRVNDFTLEKDSGTFINSILKG